jgi:hypothetical protein
MVSKKVVRKTVSPGDIFIFEMEDRSVFLQYISDDCSCCLWCQRDSGAKTEPRIVFYPIQLNVRNGNLRFVGNEPLRLPRPIQKRRPGVVLNGIVEWWFIDDGEETYRVDELNSDQRQFPTDAVMSHVVLVEWLQGRGWQLVRGQPPEFSGG